MPYDFMVKKQQHYLVSPLPEFGISKWEQTRLSAGGCYHWVKPNSPV